MSRSTVFAEQFAESQVGIALREHREDRDALLTSLTTSLEADPRVCALWLWGSFQKGEADDLSDLDPWIIVTNGTVAEMGVSLQHYAQRTGNFLSGSEAPSNAPPQGGYFAAKHEGRHGLLHVDCYWQALSAIDTVTDFFPKPPAKDRDYLIHRLDTPVFGEWDSSGGSVHASTGGIPFPEKTPLTQRQQDIYNGIDFASLMFSIAAKYLARYPDSDMTLMQYPRSGLEHAATLLEKETLIHADDWAIPDNSIDKLRCVRALVDKVAQLTVAANKQGITISPLHAVCLHRYLDMIEGILNAKS